MDQIKEKTDAATKAIKQLGEALTEQGLFARLAELNNPLQQQAEEQKSKAAKLRESHAELRPRAESRTRILGTQIDLALSQGRDSDVEANRQESAELEQSLQKILTDAAGCEARALELEQEQKQNARRVFEESYPALPEAAHAITKSLLDLLDHLEEGMRLYVQRAGIQGHFPYLFLNQRRIDDLIPHSLNGGQELMVRVDQRFGSKR